MQKAPGVSNLSSQLINQTAVIYNNDAHEDATQVPLPPVHQPDWHREEEYSTNTSRDDILISANNRSEHDSPHTGITLNPMLCSCGDDVRNKIWLL